MLKIIRSADRRNLDAVLARRALGLQKAERVVGPIIDAVRKHGDQALMKYARRLDGLRAPSVAVPSARLEEEARRLPESFRRAMELASGQIWEFCHMQMPRSWRKRVRPGLSIGQVVRPLDSVATYIPGGRYPLPSTLMMTVIPAQVAGVKNILVACPSLDPLILGAAGQLHIGHFFHMGGAQAIAAFAFGTGTVPRARRIVGPGNIYVAAAKKLLAGEVAIDFVAGPTEILLISGDGDPQWLAADLLAQAEHDPQATAMLLTTSVRHARQVAHELTRQLATLPTRAVAQQSLSTNGAIFVMNSIEEAIAFANRYAPEHLSIPDASYLDQVSNAGSVFIGPCSPEAAGDYASGPNHVLPTAGGAAIRGGLSVGDFVKVVPVQELNARGLRFMSRAITTLARAEGLEAHARSVEVRVGRYSRRKQAKGLPE